MLFGIDTAAVAGNKNPSWIQAKAEGPISFAIIRSNYGERADKTFARDWPRLRDAGLVRGAYLFLRLGGNVAGPDAQARALIETVGKLDKGDLPPTVDVEFPDGRAATSLSAGECLDKVRACCDVLAARYGGPPIIYTSARVWREDLQDRPAPDLAESPLWVSRQFFKPGPARRDPAAFEDGALSPPLPTPWGDGNWWIHQYQGNAVDLPGFPTGKVDMNRFNTMLRGATGGRVRWVQRRVGVRADGKFGDGTEKALRRYQARKGLVVDGAVGPRTFAHLCWTRPA